MASLIDSLYTGASGISTSQVGIQVTGNNIANVNTEGYSKETTSITSSTAIEQSGLLLGSGSSIKTVVRAENVFITNQLIGASADYAEYEAASLPLGQIEQIMSIDEDSLAGDIDSFFDAWEELSSAPGEATERQQVIFAAEDLVNEFQKISQGLYEVTAGINSSIESQIPGLNEKLDQVATLNESIFLTETSGSDANTLRDQRDLLVQEISGICGATSYPDENGMICLQLGNGLPLVTSDIASTMTTEQQDGLTLLSVEVAGSSYQLEADNLGGELAGLLTVRDEVIPALQNDIDRIAYELVEAVNSLHATGLDQNGDPAQELFTVAAPTDPTAPLWQGAATSMTVNLDDPALLATGTSALNGDNSLCLEISGLRNTESIDSSTFGEEYSRIASEAGLLISSNEDKLLSSLTTLNEVLEDRDEVSGVSTDEEMLLLIQYQTGYEAAANYLTVVKEMLDTLLAI